MLHIPAIIGLTLLIAVTPDAGAQEGIYICPHGTGAAAKQTVDTVVGPNDSYAYNIDRNGRPVAWDLKAKPIIEWYAAENLPSNGAAIIEQGFSDWQEAVGIPFEKMGARAITDFPVQDGVSLMLVAQDDKLGGAEGKTQRYLTSTYSTVETDIGYSQQLMDRIDDGYILTVVRHEIGHLLGLQHVDESESLMFPSISLFEVNKPIDEGTQEGIRILYGRKEGIETLHAAYLEKLEQPDPDTEGYNVTEVAINPSRTNEVFVGSTRFTNYPALSRDGGTAWVNLDAGSTRGAEFAAPDGDVLYFTSGSFVYRSRDGGATVTQLEVDGNFIQALAVDPTDPNVLYVGQSFAVHKSVDGGDNWTNLLGSPLVTSAYDIAINPDNPEVVFLATERGLYKSSDGGDTWAESGTGIDRTVVRSIAIDPVFPSYVFVGTEFGIYRSTTGGGTWTESAPELSAAAISRLLVEPYDRSAYAVTEMGIYRSTDLGTTWSRFGTGLGPKGVNAIASDPRNSNNVFVATDYGLLRTLDGGVTFETVFPVEAPVIGLARTSIDVGELEVGHTASETLTVRNVGLGPLVVADVTSDVAGVEATPTSFTVAPGDSADITVEFTAAEGAFSGLLAVHSNDPDFGLAEITVSITGIIILADPRTDFNGDGEVSFGDFVSFAQAFGSSIATFDLNDDGSVGFADFVTFAQSFGRPLG